VEIEPVLDVPKAAFAGQRRGCQHRRRQRSDELLADRRADVQRRGADAKLVVLAQRQPGDGAGVRLRNDPREVQSRLLPGHALRRQLAQDRVLHVVALRQVFEAGD
jgi:hypothetical protein